MCVCVRVLFSVGGIACVTQPHVSVCVCVEDGGIEFFYNNYVVQH